MDLQTQLKAYCIIFNPYPVSLSSRGITYKSGKSLIQYLMDQCHLDIFYKATSI